MTQLMPIFSILFFLFSLSNCGVPLTLNFLGEFMSLYATFERLLILGMLASLSIILSAAYSMFLYNRIAFGGIYSSYISANIIDLTKREFIILISLFIFTLILGISPYIILNGLNVSSSYLIFSAKLI
jgi:NADH-ubiquinone oxidoreductase chain 4